MASGQATGLHPPGQAGLIRERRRATCSGVCALTRSVGARRLHGQTPAAGPELVTQAGAAAEVVAAADAVPAAAAPAAATPARPTCASAVTPARWRGTSGG